MGVLVLRSSVVPESGGGETGDVDLSQLPTSASRNTTAYGALDVDGMAAGTAFDDPVTGVRTVKLTSSGSPNAAQHFSFYSTLGLQISQAWGAGGDQYTVAIGSTSGSSYLVDYQLGGSASNYRTFPGTEGRFAFSRLPGQERIVYIGNGSTLRRYDTEADAYADTGSFPYTWSHGLWVQLNSTETWATALSPSANTVTALNLSTSAVITQGSQTNLDEIYGGYNDIAFINRGSSSRLWDLNANTTSAITDGSNAYTHVPSLRGFWMYYDTDTGGGVMPWGRIDEDSTGDTPVNMTGYWGQLHASGHWWDQPAGDDQWALVSFWDSDGSWTSSLRDVIAFVNASTGEKRILGHHYSQAENGVSTNPGGTDGYYSQPHATPSTDGKLVLFSSNMLDTARIEAFLMEVPRAA
jgi:hypothetical protein